MGESDIQSAIRRVLSKGIRRLWRNNVGQTPHECPSCGRRFRIVRYGLCVGSSDLIGYTQVEVTPEMVGTKLAVFTAVEVKDSGVSTKEQRRFIRHVRKAGGLAGVAHSVEEAERIASPPASRG